MEGGAAPGDIEASASNFGSLNSPTGNSRTIMTPSIKTKRKESQAKVVFVGKSKESKRPMSSIGAIGSPKKGKRSKSKGKRVSLDKLFGDGLENKEEGIIGKIHLSAFETPQGSPQNSIPDQPDTPLYSEYKISVREPSNVMEKMSSPSLSPKHSTTVFSPRINFRKYEESAYRPKVSSVPTSPEASQIVDLGERMRGGSVIIGGASRVSSLREIGRRPSRILSKELEAKYGIKLGDNDSESEDSEEENKDKVEVGKKKISIREMIWGKQSFSKEISEEQEGEKEKKSTRRRRLQVKKSTAPPKEDEFKMELKKKFQNFIGFYSEGVKAVENEGRNTTREQEILLEQYKPMMVRMNEEGNKVVKPKFMKNMGTMCFTELWPRELRIKMQMMLEKKVVKKKREERLSIQKGRTSRRESQINLTVDKRLKGDDQNLKSWREIERNSGSNSPSFEKIKVVKSVGTLGTLRTRASLSNVTSRVW